MKIDKLHINNFRGIVDLELDFSSKSAIIVGPNGAGKSAVIDAIDFLLRGGIRRLEGEATGDVSILKHGPHVGALASNSKVSAEIQSINGSKFTVTRTVENRNKIEIEEIYRTEFSAIENYASKNAHFLSRRELLNFILSTPKTRSEQIQILLDMINLKEIRTAFKNLKKKATSDFNEIKTKNENNINGLYRTLNITSENEILQKINEFRLILGSEEIKTLDENFINKLNYKDTNYNGIISKLILNLKELEKFLPIFIQKLIFLQQQINTYLIQINIEKEILSEVGKTELITNGIKLLDGSGRCPLCMHQWISEEELKEFLIERGKKSELICELIDSFNENKKSLNMYFDEYKQKLEQLLIIKEYNEDLFNDLNIEIKNINEFSNLKKLSVLEFNIINDKLFKYIDKYNETKFIEKLTNQIKNLDPLIDKQDQIKSEAWQALNNAKQYYKQIYEYKKNEPKNLAIVKKAEKLFEEYEEIQERNLNELYNSVSERFSEFYKIMHRYDERNFNATLTNNKSGVDMRVNFHDTGLVPPMAYHSEGHQDSMGIALFFALIEKLNTVEYGLIALDDIVMSVDIEHRKDFCKLLKQYFPDYQFIITTHDEIWARHIINERIVDKQNYFIFSGWNVQEGPIIVSGKNIWETSRKKADNNLADASSYFRREMENYFENVCDKLKAKIQYNSELKWDYGEYKDAAISRFNKLLNQAIKYYNNLNKQEEVEKIKYLKNKLTDSSTKLDSENWVINILIHYNPRYQFSKNEFLSAIKTMESFCSNFECEDCKSIVKHINDSENTSILKCECGNYLLFLKN